MIFTVIYKNSVASKKNRLLMMAENFDECLKKSLYIFGDDLLEIHYSAEKNSRIYRNQPDSVTEPEKI